MSTKRNFTAPVWCVILIICIQLLFLYIMISMTVSMYEMGKQWKTKNNSTYPMPGLYPILLKKTIQAGITVLALITECFILWRIRKKFYGKFLALGYILPLLCAMIILPFWGISVYNYRYFLKPDAFMYWILVILSQVFWVIILLQAYWFRKVKVSDNSENLLDDFADL